MSVCLFIPWAWGDASAFYNGWNQTDIFVSGIYIFVADLFRNWIMPGKLKAKIVAGRHLPVMDRASELTDAFVEVSKILENMSINSWSLPKTNPHGVFLFSGEVRKYDFQNWRLPQIPKSAVEFRVVQIWGTGNCEVLNHTLILWNLWFPLSFSVPLASRLMMRTCRMSPYRLQCWTMTRIVLMTPSGKSTLISTPFYAVRLPLSFLAGFPSMILSMVQKYINQKITLKISCICIFQISVWWSVFLGIRGEINVLVKVELFNDLNRFRQSSCGVKFFCSMLHINFYHTYQIMLNWNHHAIYEKKIVNCASMQGPRRSWVDYYIIN